MTDDYIQKHKYLLFTVGAIGTFMATLDGSILNVALPTISSDLNISVDVVAWVALAYTLTLISLMLVFGVWVGKKGYYFAYRFGYVFFIAGSTLCALSGTLHLLLFGRVVQAIGTAMFASIGPGMVTTVFGEKERGKGIGMMVMMVSAGFMVGPPLGGFLLHFYSWPSIFVINIPIGFIGLFMTFRYFKQMPKPTGDQKLKWKSAASMSSALVTLTFALSSINDYPLTDYHIWGLGSISFILFCFFVYFESRPETAMIGFSVLRNRHFTASIGAMLFMFAAIAGVLLLVPFYLENIRHYDPKQVGLFLIILPIMMFVFAPLSGRLSDKIGFRFLTVTGLLVSMVGLYITAQLNIDSTPGFIILCLSLLGMGNGIFNTPNSSALMGSVKEEQRAVTSSILGTTRNIGMSLGVALSTTLFAYFQTKNSGLGEANLIFVRSYSTVIYVSIAIAVISLLFSIFRGKHRLQETGT